MTKKEKIIIVVAIILGLGLTILTGSYMHKAWNYVNQVIEESNFAEKACINSSGVLAWSKLDKGCGVQGENCFALVCVPRPQK